jgi:hypothetical protein
MPAFLTICDSCNAVIGIAATDRRIRMTAFFFVEQARDHLAERGFRTAHDRSLRCVEDLKIRWADFSRIGFPASHFWM